MIEQLNMSLFHLINQYAGLNPFIDILAIFAAKYMPLIIVLGLIYLWIKREDKTQDIVLYGVYAAVIGLLINYIIGLVYFHPRPFMIPTGTLLFSYPGDSSFPSDHTTLMLSLTFMLTYFRETRKIGLLFVVLGLIGGFARVFCGVHFPMDILGSVVVSLIITAAIFKFRNRLTPINNLFKGFYAKVISSKE
jgi:undecaprenyl-diphosphatase